MKLNFAQTLVDKIGFIYLMIILPKLFASMTQAGFTSSFALATKKCNAPSSRSNN